MKNIITTIIAVISFGFTTYAQPGSINRTFKTLDVSFGNGDGANDIV